MLLSVWIGGLEFCISVLISEFFSFKNVLHSICRISLNRSSSHLYIISQDNWSCSVPWNHKWIKSICAKSD